MSGQLLLCPEFISKYFLLNKAKQSKNHQPCSVFRFIDNIKSRALFIKINGAGGELFAVILYAALIDNIIFQLALQLSDSMNIAAFQQLKQEAYAGVGIFQFNMYIEWIAQNIKEVICGFSAVFLVVPYPAADTSVMLIADLVFTYFDVSIIYLWSITVGVFYAEAG